LDSDQPISLVGRLDERLPRRDLWIFHIEDRADRPRLWATTVADVGGRGEQSEIEFANGTAAVAHLEAFIRSACSTKSG
jgi:hypothetical protein